MLSLLLWNSAYFFGGIANFFLNATLIIVFLYVAIQAFAHQKKEPGLEEKPQKQSGCSTLLLLVAGLSFLLFVFAQTLV